MMKDLPINALSYADLKELKHKDIAQMMGIKNKSRVKLAEKNSVRLLVSCCGSDCTCHEKPLNRAVVINHKPEDLFPNGCLLWDLITILIKTTK